MTLYTVTRLEVHKQPIDIEADSPDDARIRVANGEGMIIEAGFEFHNLVPMDQWDVLEVDESLDNWDGKF
jgi:hypothetical protein